MRQFSKAKQYYGISALRPQQIQELDDVELIFQSINNKNPFILNTQINQELDFVHSDNQFKDIVREKRKQYYIRQNETRKYQQLRDSHQMAKKSQILQYEKNKVNNLLNFIQKKISMRRVKNFIDQIQLPLYISYYVKMIVNNKLMVDQQQLQLTNESLRSLVFKIYNSKLSYHEFLITEGRIQPQQILQIPMIVNSSISMISQHQSFQDGQTLVWCFDDTENTVLQVLRLKQRDLKKIVFQLSKEINKPKQSQLQEIQLQQISNLVNNSSSIIDINLQPIQPQQLVNNFNIFSEDTKNDIMSYSGIFDQVELKNESIPIHQLQNKSELQQNINNVTQNFAPLSFLPPRPNSFVNLIEQHTPTQLRLEEQNIQRNQHLDDLNSDENQNKKHQQESNFLKMSDSGDGQNIKNEESEIIGLQQKIQDVELVTANLILQAEYVQEMDLTLDKMAQQINRLTKQIVGNKRMIVHGRFEQYLTCCVLISVVLILKFSYRLDE